MTPTFDIFSIQTVKPTYSWDLGTPLVDYFNLTTNVSEVSSPSNNSKRVEYIGYAPFMSVSLSSIPGMETNSITTRRIVDFGDYYNTETNTLISPLTSEELFCHTYIMPGLYSIKFNRMLWNCYTTTWESHGHCLDKYCMDWEWGNFKDCPPERNVTWQSTRCGGQYAKTWKFEGCVDPTLPKTGLYIEREKKQERYPLSWHWSNFLCVNSTTNPRNTPVTWEEAFFQRSGQTTWIESQGPCVTLSDYESYKFTAEYWTWKAKSCIGKTENSLTNYCNIAAGSPTWANLKTSTTGTCVTWKYARTHCTSYSSVTRAVSSDSVTIENEAFIRVLEIPPVAYLQYTPISPSKKNISPYTVRLSPSGVKCGSFPIEKIIWDLGDGSPLLEQRRWSNTLNSPFVYSGSLSSDYKDPRNYDIVYTYFKTPSSDFSFYPSITAICSSTGSYDCASVLIGPIQLDSFADDQSNNNSIKIIQSELTDSGRILIGQIGDTVCAWKADK